MESRGVEHLVVTSHILGSGTSVTIKWTEWVFQQSSIDADLYLLNFLDSKT